MYRLLVVDDEEKIRKLIRKYAEFEGHQVTEAENGMEAVELVRRSPEGFDLVIMDVMMPEVDDYVVKPFSPKELMLRVNAIMNRARPQEESAKRRQVALEGLCIDFDARVVTVDGQRAELSPKEYELLTYLVENKGLALTREMLITNVWGYDFYGDDRTLDTHIKLLRKSLGPYSRFIVTLRGVGYRFDA